MVRCTWDRTDDEAAEQTAHPTAVRAGGRVFSSHSCTQIDECAVKRQVNAAGANPAQGGVGTSW